MNRRYLLLAALAITMILVGMVVAKPVWSICDPSDPTCAAVTLPYATSQGYWNYQYDDAAPFTTAGLYCCWWERWYKWQKFSQWKGEQNTLNIGSSDDVLGSAIQTESYLPESNMVETKSFKSNTSGVEQVSQDDYCPSCCSTCDDDTSAKLQARSDAIMAKKPWLTEGKKVSGSLDVAPTTATSEPKSTKMVMSFSAAK